MPLDFENIAGTTPSPAQAEEALAAYPYFVWPAAVAIKGNDEIAPDKKAAFERRIACCVGNEEARLRILGDDTARFEDFYPDMKPAASTTADAIKEFMDIYGPKTPLPEDSYPDSSGEETASATPDEEDETASAINSFLAKMPPASEVPVASRVEVEEMPKSADSEKVAFGDDSLSELIGSGRYADAIEIIERRGLQNPEKSIYFASQIRFLRKLMINDNFQKH